MAALTATRRRPEGHGAAPGPELAPLARGSSRTRARAGVDPGGTTPALGWPATASRGNRGPSAERGDGPGTGRPSELGGAHRAGSRPSIEETIMAISMWKTASKGHAEAGPRASSPTDRPAATRSLTGPEPREGRTLPSMTATHSGESGPGPYRQEITDAGDGDTIRTSTNAEQLLLRWQRQGDCEAWDRLAEIVVQATRRRSAAHRGRLKCSSFDADDVSQEALHRFVRGASHIYPYNVHGFITRLIDRSAGDLNRTACRAKRGGGRTVQASVYWSDDRDDRQGKARSSDSPACTLATQEGLDSGVCFDESEMFYIRRAFEPYSDRADETTAKAWRLAELLSNDARALGEGLGCSQRAIRRQRASLR